MQVVCIFMGAALLWSDTSKGVFRLLELKQEMSIGQSGRNWLVISKHEELLCTLERYFTASHS